MKKVEELRSDVGVIVGRFHVDNLHEAHVDLIQSVCNEHDKIIIFLGLAPLKGTVANPLDFECRKQMIQEKFPDVNILYIKDTKENAVWSKKLDEQVSDIVGPNQTVVMYGSRDSFIKSYEGKYPTQELMQEVYVSGTEIRRKISRKVRNDAKFRGGIIWGTYNRYPTVFTTVDVAILNEDGDKILLARKPYENEYRFIGGFADPNSSSFEADARREVMEEAGIDISDPEYIGSFKIDDWRYRNEVDKIKTILFTCKLVSGRPKAADDICEVKWFSISDLTKALTKGDLSVVAQEHQDMMGVFLTKRLQGKV
jgi:bifunctional NMN adenylyltransferase/nudix hydrolase